ncbi:MAG: hypothetical protein LBF76_03490 [Holosporales bacterium]|nr:hypothetical protein [Holosporales bacterium]
MMRKILLEKKHPASDMLARIFSVEETCFLVFGNITPDRMPSITTLMKTVRETLLPEYQKELDQVITSLAEGDQRSFCDLSQNLAKALQENDSSQLLDNVLQRCFSSCRKDFSEIGSLEDARLLLGGCNDAIEHLCALDPENRPFLRENLANLEKCLISAISADPELPINSSASCQRLFSETQSVKDQLWDIGARERMYAASRSLLQGEEEGKGQALLILLTQKVPDLREIRVVDAFSLISAQKIPPEKRENLLGMLRRDDAGEISGKIKSFLENCCFFTVSESDDTPDLALRDTVIHSVLKENEKNRVYRQVMLSFVASWEPGNQRLNGWGPCSEKLRVFKAEGGQWGKHGLALNPDESECYDRTLSSEGVKSYLALGMTSTVSHEIGHALLETCLPMAKEGESVLEAIMEGSVTAQVGGCFFDMTYNEERVKQFIARRFEVDPSSLSDDFFRKFWVCVLFGPSVEREHVQIQGTHYDPVRKTLYVYALCDAAYALSERRDVRFAHISPPPGRSPEIQMEIHYTPNDVLGAYYDLLRCLNGAE